MRKEYREALNWLRSCESDQFATREDPASSYVASQLGLAIELLEGCAVDPIPLSERRPKDEDFNASGQAWYGQPQPFSDEDRWDWCYTSSRYGEGSSFTHWLPASIKYLPARVEL